MTVIKLGGSFLEDNDSLERFGISLKELSNTCVIVHGGGRYIDDLAGRLAISHTKIDGIRSTSAELMHVVDMVLTGRVNTWLVRRLCRLGHPAIGISLSSGHMARAQRVSEHTDNHTGTILNIDTQIMNHLLDHAMIPVISPTAMDAAGEGINVNADDAATAIAIALQADHLLFISDVPGVISEEKVLSRIDLPQARALIDSNIINKGMTAKIAAAGLAVEKGVPHVAISNIEKQDDLAQLMQGNRGTNIYIG